MEVVDRIRNIPEDSSERITDQHFAHTDRSLVVTAARYVSGMWSGAGVTSKHDV